LILEKATFDFNSGLWNVSAQVQFNESGTFHDVLIRCRTHSFKNERDARKHIIENAKNWIDNRRSHAQKSAGPVLAYSAGKERD
jgi:hypothetical protein